MLQTRHLVGVLRAHHPLVADMAEQALLADASVWRRAPPPVQHHVLQGIMDWAHAVGSEGLPGTVGECQQPTARLYKK